MLTRRGFLKLLGLGAAGAAGAAVAGSSAASSSTVGWKVPQSVMVPLGFEPEFVVIEDLPNDMAVADGKLVGYYNRRFIEALADGRYLERAAGGRR